MPYIIVCIKHNSNRKPAIEPGGVSRYYIDATGGNDANSGRSPTSAWKTIAKVNASTFLLGDWVLFKRGEVWTGTQLATQSNVKYSDYGTGNLPVIAATVIGTPAIVVNTKTGVIIQNIKVSAVAAWTIRFGTWIAGLDGEGSTYCMLDAIESDGPIYVFGHHNTVKNSTIYGISNNGLAGATVGNGIMDLYAPCHHNSYLNNIVHHFTARGFWSMKHTHDNVYSGNTIYSVVDGNDGIGINVDGYQDVVWRHTIDRNTIYSCGEIGIAAENGFDCIVQNNKVHNCGKGISSHLYSECLVGGESNQYGVNGDARGMDANLLYRQNIVYDNTINGFFIYDTGKVKIYGNTIYGNGEQGVYYLTTVAYSPHNELVSNIIMNNNGNGAQVAVPYTDFICLAVDNKNIIYNAGGTAAYSEHETFTTKTLAAYRTTTGLAANSIASNPTLVDPVTTHNFHLIADSPAIAAGETNGLATDYDGVARGAVVDIGALEYI